MKPRRVVTGHDGHGRSVVLSDGPVPRSHAVPDAEFHEVWNTPSVPAPVTATEPREPTDRPLITPPDAGGKIIRVVDLAPGSVSPLRRTESIDYGVVQRGTDHAWANHSEAPARMVFILVDGRFSSELQTLLPDAKLFDHGLDA